MFPREVDPHSYAQVENFFVADGLTLNLVNIAPNLLSGINLVSIGIGCCLVSDHATQIKREGVVDKTLAKSNLIRTLSIITLSGVRSLLIDGSVHTALSRSAYVTQV
jgi:hypothetical protein